MQAHYNFTDPLNLWNYPFMRNVQLDNRARSLKLNPPPRAIASQRPAPIEPARGEANSYEFARAIHCKQFGGRR
jgi:hypothetical protein